MMGSIEKNGNSEVVALGLKVMDASRINPSIQYSLKQGQVFKTIDCDFNGRGNYVDYPTDEEQAIISLLNKLDCFVYHILYTEYEEGYVVFGTTRFLLIPTVEQFPHADKYDLEHGELVAAAERGVLYAFTIRQDCGCGKCGFSVFEVINVKSENGRLTAGH